MQRKIRNRWLQVAELSTYAMSRKNRFHSGSCCSLHHIVIEGGETPRCGARLPAENCRDAIQEDCSTAGLHEAIEEKLVVDLAKFYQRNFEGNSGH